MSPVPDPLTSSSDDDDDDDPQPRTVKLVPRRATVAAAAAATATAAAAAAAAAATAAAAVAAAVAATAAAADTTAAPLRHRLLTETRRQSLRIRQMTSEEAARQLPTHCLQRQRDLAAEQWNVLAHELYVAPSEYGDSLYARVPLGPGYSIYYFGRFHSNVDTAPSTISSPYTAANEDGVGVDAAAVPRQYASYADHACQADRRCNATLEWDSDYSELYGQPRVVLTRAVAAGEPIRIDYGPGYDYSTFSHDTRSPSMNVLSRILWNAAPEAVTAALQLLCDHRRVCMPGFDTATERALSDQCLQQWASTLPSEEAEGIHGTFLRPDGHTEIKSLGWLRASEVPPCRCSRLPPHTHCRPSTGLPQGVAVSPMWYMLTTVTPEPEPEPECDPVTALDDPSDGDSGGDGDDSADDDMPALEAVSAPDPVLTALRAMQTAATRLATSRQRPTADTPSATSLEPVQTALRAMRTAATRLDGAPTAVPTAPVHAPVPEPEPEPEPEPTAMLEGARRYAANDIRRYMPMYRGPDPDPESMPTVPRGIQQRSLYRDGEASTLTSDDDDDDNDEFDLDEGDEPDAATIDRSGNAAANRLEAVIASIARREGNTRETRERAQRIRRDILVARRIRGGHGHVPALQHAWEGLSVD